MADEDIRTEDLRKIAEDATVFPILTESASFPQGSGRSGLSAGIAPLSQKVDVTLREILGWRPRNNDPRGFLASLTQSFEIKDFEGHTQWAWRPRTYAAEADLGAITGAQASLYSRARAALDQALPLLDGLTPLRADHDLEDIEAARAIVQSGLTELVYELGIEGGPRLARVDGYFSDLLGRDSTQLPSDKTPNPRILDNPENVGGQLSLLQQAFGLLGAQVNTVDEEQNLTNFMILVDLVNSLWLTWRSQRDFFNHKEGGKAYLGTQLLLLSRNLSVVAESVEEVYFAMNSVYLGPAERQTTRLDLPDGVVFVGELLDWVYRFATEEGPRLLREGGKDGVTQAFRPTIDRLTNLVTGALTISQKKSNNPTHGFHSSRVQLALNGLEFNLKTTQRNAGQISRLPAPEIKFIEYDLVSSDQASEVSVLLTISGNHFQKGVELSLSITDDSLPIQQLIFVTPTMIRAVIDLTEHFSNMPSTQRWLPIKIKIKNPDHQEAIDSKNVEIFRRLFSLEPSISTIAHDPVTITDHQKLKNLLVTITGANFQSGSKASTNLLIGGVAIPTVSPELRSSNEIKATFDLSKIKNTGGDIEGKIIVTNPDGQSVIAGAVVIKASPNAHLHQEPTIGGVIPKNIPIKGKANLSNIELKITGTNFQKGAEVKLEIDGTHLKSKRILAKDISDTGIKARFDLKSAITSKTNVDAKVIVTNPDDRHAESKVTIKYTP